MTIAIILSVVLFIGFLLARTFDFEELGIVIIVFVGVMLLIHLLFFSLRSYDYGLFKAKRNAFEQTLSNARETGNEYETAAIVKEVAAWNTELASRKYDNKTLFLDQYIDDRIDDLEPIK